MQPLDQIFLQWTGVVNPAWIVLLFAMTTAHAYFFTLIDNWL
jgi:hypothetical protein